MCPSGSLMFASLLLTALSTAVITVALTSIFVLLLLKRAKQQIFAEFNRFITDTMESVAKEPKKFSDLLKPVLMGAVDDLIKDLQKGSGGAGNGFGGLTAESALNLAASNPQMALKMIPRQYRGIASLYFMFRGGLGGSGGQQGSPSSKSPFEK